MSPVTPTGLLRDSLKDIRDGSLSLQGLKTLVDTWMGKDSTRSVVNDFKIMEFGILLTITAIDGRKLKPSETEIVIPDHVRVFKQDDGLLFYWNNNHRRVHLKH